MKVNELTSSFSYEPGDEVAAYDEVGDPVYVGAGLAPRFQALAKEYAEQLQKNRNG